MYCKPYSSLGESASMRDVYIKESVIRSVLEYASACHPREGILLLRGKVDKREIWIEEVELPPLSIHGVGFSSFRADMLPIDLSIVGTAHSHPSGVLKPSVMDLNRFYGRVMAIVAYPYRMGVDFAIFDGEGKRIRYKIIDG